jgi:hypothetical protein
VDRGLGQHGVVFQLRLAERRGVAGDEDQLGLARTESYSHRMLARFLLPDFECAQERIQRTYQGGLVTQNDLTRLHHQGEARVEGVSGLGLLLGGHFD